MPFYHYYCFSHFSEWPKPAGTMNLHGNHKAAFIRGWIGDTVVQKLRKFEWSATEWDEYEKVLERFELVIQPTNRNQNNRYALELSNYRQTTETFTEFETEMKRRFTLAGIVSVEHMMIIRIVQVVNKGTGR